MNIILLCHCFSPSTWNGLLLWRICFLFAYNPTKMNNHMMRKRINIDDILLSLHTSAISQKQKLMCSHRPNNQWPLLEYTNYIKCKLAHKINQFLPFIIICVTITLPDTRTRNKWSNWVLSTSASYGKAQFWISA
jgi:hypothetical protein